MHTSRSDKFAAFDSFFRSTNELFAGYAASDSRSKWLDDYYSLCICPGGRHGGINKKVVEVFFGNRPIDSFLELDKNLNTIEKLEIAHGATLAYLRRDDGRVLCRLFPAASENQRHEEDFIELADISEPSELGRMSVRHWRYLVAYMEITCIDGSPSIWQRIIVFYLRNFRPYVSKAHSKESKAFVAFKEIFKYVMTVGLSGFLLLAISSLKDASSKDAAGEYQRKVLESLSATQTSVRDIAELEVKSLRQLEEINVGARESLDALRSMSSKPESSCGEVNKNPGR